MKSTGLDDATFKACCAATYGSDLASAVLGPTYHPGGRELTRRLARMGCIRPGERVLDVASGPGHTALLLAEEFDAVVRGIDLSPTLVERASSAASERKLAERVSFEVADAERLRAGQEHDLVFCECALCTFPDKRRAVEGFAAALAPGGRLCLSDVVIDRAGLPDELLGMVGRIACVAEALPADGYLRLLEGSGLRVCGLEHHDDAVVDMVERIDARLAFVAAAGGRALAGLDLARARELAAMAVAAVRDGVIGYVLVTAELEGAASLRR
ncbi:MAG: class I SAM-dependent methyltransferase [Actinomycetota bacterium]|nr:class I SAM-dependent methyltransferase [Actinomycetota bacterium]MDH5314781.1 class I SAM-dependent methyltransferase [Actinomycetota bacterium]